MGSKQRWKPTEVERSGRPGAHPASHCCPSADRWHAKRHDSAFSCSAGMMGLGTDGHQDYTTHGGFFSYFCFFPAHFVRDTHTHPPLCIHPSPHYHTACTPVRGGGDGTAGGGEGEGGELCGVVVSPHSVIQVLWSSFDCDDTGTFPFPSNQKMLQEV